MARVPFAEYHRSQNLDINYRKLCQRYCKHFGHRCTVSVRQLSWCSPLPQVSTPFRMPGGIRCRLSC
jgi:hypothetical protein